MHVRALLSFIEVARSGSIRQAAQRLGIAPTALNRQLASLEYFFRAGLLDRRAAGVALTEAGRLLAARAAMIGAEIETTRALIDDLRGLERGHASIRAAGAVVGGLLAPVLARLHERHPRLRFSIDVTSAAELVAGVADGTVDLGVTIFAPDSAAPLIAARHPIAHSAIVSPGHPLAGLERVSLAELTRHALALPGAGFGARQDLDRIARAASRRLDPVFITGSLDMQKALALRGAAVLILPPLCCADEIEAGRLVAVALAEDSLIETSLVICRAPDRVLPHAAEAVIAELERFLVG